MQTNLGSLKFITQAFLNFHYHDIMFYFRIKDFMQPIKIYLCILYCSQIFGQPAITSQTNFIIYAVHQIVCQIPQSLQQVVVFDI